MKNISKIVSGLAAFTIMAVGAAGVAVPADATLFGNDDLDLGNLIILDQLFSGGVFGGTAATGARTVVVQPGDTLSGIALRFLGNANLFPSIASLNNISNPDLIFPGQVLTLPVAATGGTTGGIFDGGSNLGDLIILDQLFDGGGIFGGGDTDLGDLFILQALFGGEMGGIFNGGTGTTGGIFGGSNLGNLILLDELFGGGGIFD